MVAHYIFNLVAGDASRATGLMRARMWGVGAVEPHRDALAPGDLILVYLAAHERKVPMSAVLAQIDRSAGARADFETGVVRITAGEYETTLAVAARHGTSPG